MFKKFILPMTLMIVIVGVACSGGNSGADPTILPETGSGSSSTEVETSEPLQDEEQEILPEPDPIDLEITLEEGNTIEREIGPEGGSLEVVGADGTRYLLEIPPDALLSPITIRLTPAESVEGLPIEGEFQGLVNLEPKGLVFFTPAELSIFPAAEGEIGEILAYGSRDLGEDFHLYPEEEIEDGVKLRINHFSNYGVQNAEVQRVTREYVPSEAETYAHDQQATIINYIDGDDAQLEALVKIQREWFLYSVEVNLTDAALDADLIDRAVGEYLSWRSDIDSLDAILEGDGELAKRLSAEIERGLEALATALKFGIDNAYDSCVVENDFEASLRMVRYTLLTTGLELWGRSGLDRDQVQQQFTTCFQFEFVFNSYFEGTTQSNNKISEVKAVVPYQFLEGQQQGTTFSDTAPLIFVRNEVDLAQFGDNCFMSSNETEISASVDLDLNWYLDAPRVEAIQVTMAFLGQAQELVICEVGGQDVPFPLPFWRAVFQVVYQDLFEGANLIVELPIVREGATFAEIEFSGPTPDPFSGEERSSFQFIHTPGKVE